MTDWRRGKQAGMAEFFDRLNTALRVGNSRHFKLNRRLDVN